MGLRKEERNRHLRTYQQLGQNTTGVARRYPPLASSMRKTSQRGHGACWRSHSSSRTPHLQFRFGEPETHLASFGFVLAGRLRLSLTGRLCPSLDRLSSIQTSPVGASLVGREAAAIQKENQQASLAPGFGHRHRGKVARQSRFVFGGSTSHNRGSRWLGAGILYRCWAVVDTPACRFITPIGKLLRSLTGLSRRLSRTFLAQGDSGCWSLLLEKDLGAMPILRGLKQRRK